jgi:hypothetical protein
LGAELGETVEGIETNHGSGLVVGESVLIIGQDAIAWIG